MTNEYKENKIRVSSDSIMQLLGEHTTSCELIAIHVDDLKQILDFALNDCKLNGRTHDWNLDCNIEGGQLYKCKSCMAQQLVGKSIKLK